MHMAKNKLNTLLIRTVHWTSWPLLLLLALFFVTGYIMSGRFGFGGFMDEKGALAIHKMLHLPLMILTLAHSLPAIVLAFQRWGWIRPVGSALIRLLHLRVR